MGTQEVSWIAQALPWASLIVACLAVLGFLDARKKIIMNEGARMKEIDTLKSDVKEAHDKIAVLERVTQDARVDTSEIKKDISYIMKGQDKLSATLDLIMSELRKPRKECE